MNYEQLTQTLLSSSDNKRLKAAEALRQQGEPGGQLSEEAFIHLLLHDTAPLRRAVVEILREWREYVPIEPLFLAMQDANEQVRSMAKWAFIAVGECAPPESLLPYLTDADTTVRAAVLTALGTRAPVAVVLEALESPDETMYEAAVSLLDLLGERVPVEHFINVLQTGAAPLRTIAARALGTRGEQIPLEPLIAALHDTEIAVRLEAVGALANAGERMPKTALRGLLADTDERLRNAAVKALACTGDAQALALIVESLHADHEWARETALMRLLTGFNVQMRAITRHLPIAELLHLLKDEWWPVGYMTARMIATLGEDAPFIELLALVSHPLPEARSAALHALALLGQHLSLSQYIPIEPVLSALEAEDVETRRGAAEVLDFFGSRLPIEKLLACIEEEDTQVASILAQRGRPEGRDALVRSLRTLDNAWHASIALGKLGKDAPAEPLLAALYTSEVTVRQAAAEALYKTHPELLPALVPELLETLSSGHVGPLLAPLPHILLMRALVTLRSPLPTLVAWFDRSLAAPDWEVRMWAIFGLRAVMPHIPDGTPEKLRRLLDDPESANVRRVAGYALDELVPPIVD